MNILIAPDKFKSSLSAREVTDTLAAILLRAGHGVIGCPLADGGEGTSFILTESCGGRLVEVLASDPLMRHVRCSYGISPDSRTAFIEMSQASGLWRLHPEEYNPGVTSTFGTGELILNALSLGVREIILGCGGSATNDGGTGMAAALGWQFLDPFGKSFLPTGDTLHQISALSQEKVNPLLNQITFTVISDVLNPLTGPKGAALTFGLQKGATADQLIRLDYGLGKLDELFQHYSGQSFDDLPGSGAGGGLGAGARFFFHATWDLGIHVVMDRTGIENKIKCADLVITGEGKLDRQSLDGKVVSGVASLCRKHGKRLIIVCGVNELTAEESKPLHAERILSLAEVAGSAERARAQPQIWIEKLITEVEL